MRYCEPFFCDECDFYSNTKRGLKTHITRKHNNKNNTLTVKEQESFDTVTDTDKEECNILNKDGILLCLFCDTIAYDSSIEYMEAMKFHLFSKHVKRVQKLYKEFSSGNKTEESRLEVAYIKLINLQLSEDDRQFYLEKFKYLERPLFRVID